MEIAIWIIAIIGLINTAVSVGILWFWSKNTKLQAAIFQAHKEIRNRDEERRRKEDVGRKQMEDLARESAMLQNKLMHKQLVMLRIQEDAMKSTGFMEDEKQ